MTICRAAAGSLILVCAGGCLAVTLGHLVYVPIAHASAKADRELGATVFHEKGCEHCHGVGGIGTDRGPELSSVGRKLHPPEIEKQIQNGGSQMPAFGDALTNDEMKQLVAYLSAMKKKVKKAKSVSLPH
jgi:mono/diheme cytochrome c family protein